MLRWLSIGAAMIGLVACGSRQMASKTFGERTIYFSLIEKSAEQAFYNRLASPTWHLVAGPAALPQAIADVAVTEEHESELYIVEGQPLPRERLRGEKARLDQFAIVAVPVGYPPHDFLGTHAWYVERVQAELNKPDGLNQDNSKFDLSMLLRHESGDDRADWVGQHAAIDTAVITRGVRQLSGAEPVTVRGRALRLADRKSAQGREDARLYLRQAYEALGFEVEDAAYSSGFKRGVNFVARRKPAKDTQDQGIVILSSHLDSVGNAGADDNAAGTIAALAAAQALQGLELKHELRILAFDQEEDGLLGSAAYVKQLRASGEIQRVLANITIEMPGYDADDDGRIHVIDCDENTSSSLTRVAEAALGSANPPLSIEPACTNRSDHASFWRAGRPSVVISQNFFGGDSNPCYHKACDRVDGINFDYMRRITTLVARTAEALTAAAN